MNAKLACGGAVLVATSVVVQGGQARDATTESAATAASSPAARNESPHATPAHAARGITVIAYDMSMPVGETFDYTSNFSGRGVSLEYRYLLSPHLSVGLLGRWHVLSDKRHSTERRDALTITATELRTINAVPVQLTGHYYFTRFGTLPTPYAGTGVGLHWSERRSAIPGWGHRRDAWHFGVAPELGLLIPVGIHQIALATRLHCAFASGDKPYEAYFNFSVGLAEL